MGLSPSVFWHMTLAEWRCACAGYRAKVRESRYQAAFIASFVMRAAGVEAALVTPSILMGEDDGEPIAETPKLEDIWSDLQAAAAARVARVAEVGEDVVKAEEAAALAGAREQARRVAYGT